MSSTALYTWQRRQFFYPFLFATLNRACYDSNALSLLALIASSTTSARHPSPPRFVTQNPSAHHQLKESLIQKKKLSNPVIRRMPVVTIISGGGCRDEEKTRDVAETPQVWNRTWDEHPATGQVANDSTASVYYLCIKHMLIRSDAM